VFVGKDSSWNSILSISDRSASAVGKNLALRASALSWTVSAVLPWRVASAGIIGSLFRL
jgi:hypothetical protein